LGELKVPGENPETSRCCLQWMYWKDVEVDYPAGKSFYSTLLNNYFLAEKLKMRGFMDATVQTMCNKAKATKETMDAASVNRVY
jgi:hypothetical protein